MAVDVGPYWYTRTIGTMRTPRCARPLPGVMNRCASTVWFDVVMSTETWVGTDGTMRQRSVEVSQSFASAADRATWLHSRRPVPVSIAQGDALDIGGGHFPGDLFGAFFAPTSCISRRRSRSRQPKGLVVERGLRRRAAPSRSPAARRRRARAGPAGPGRARPLASSQGDAQARRRAPARRGSPR
jgi:hypothetical protein